MTTRHRLAGAALALCAYASAWDEERVPVDYTCVTQGGKYIFVMLAPKKWRKYTHDYSAYPFPTSVKPVNKDGNLFDLYPSSGLYRNDGSKKPLWTVDWYSFQVWPCSDGQHAVRWGPWARSGDQGQTLALAFYRGGKEIARHRVVDLIPDFKALPQTESHYRWARKTSFDDAGKRVKVQMYKGYDYQQPGQTLLFDITSGKFKQWIAGLR